MDKKREAWLQELSKSAAARFKTELKKFGDDQEFQPGDRFLFKAVRSPVSWVSILPNKDDASMWYFVAADFLSYVGSFDVSVEDEPGPEGMKLRCGHGLWIRRADLPEGNLFAGRIDQDWVDYAKEKLQSIVTGDLVSTPEAQLTEIDGEYQLWDEQLENATDFLESYIQEPAQVFSITPNSIVAKPASEQSQELALAMAAAGEDALVVDKSNPIPPRVVIENVFAGRLEAVAEKDGLQLIYHATANGDSPEAVVLVDGVAFDGEWGDPVGGVYLMSQAIQATGKTQLIFESGKKITIEASNA